MPPDEIRIFIIFYEQFWSIINSIKQRDALAIRRDFNVKIVTGIRMENQLLVEKYTKAAITHQISKTNNSSFHLK